MFAYLIKNFLIILVLFIVNSCKLESNNSIKSENKIMKKELISININNLLIALKKADSKLTPVLIYSENGNQFYKYQKFPGGKNLSLNEIEEWVKIGPNFFKKDIEFIKLILTKLNKLEINNSIVNIDSGALGLWIPVKNTLLIDSKVISMGSRIFLEILRHESIHVAQSCYSGSKNDYPKRIGLSLEFSQDINNNLTHRLYSKNSKEGLFMEREAFSYSKVDGAAIKLLERFCF